MVLARKFMLYISIRRGLEMKILFRSVVCGVALLFSAASAGYAADIIGGSTYDYCRIAGTSDLVLTGDLVELRSKVEQLMDDSINVADSPEWINSSRPAFVWATEAKVACGKAYGYLKTNYKDEDYLNKCECFHNRMLEYMN
jgi:hypothetical protein